MAERDDDMRRAFENGYVAGYRDAEPSEYAHVIEAKMLRVFEKWASNNGVLYDGIPSVIQMIRKIESKLTEIECCAREMKGDS